MSLPPRPASHSPFSPLLGNSATFAGLSELPKLVRYPAALNRTRPLHALWPHRLGVRRELVLRLCCMFIQSYPLPRPQSRASTRCVQSDLFLFLNFGFFSIGPHSVAWGPSCVMKLKMCCLVGEPQGWICLWLEGGGAIYDRNPVIMGIWVGTYATDAALDLYLLCETCSFQDFCGNIFFSVDGQRLEVVLLTPPMLFLLFRALWLWAIFWLLNVMLQPLPTLNTAVPMVLLALERLKTRANGKEYTQAINTLLSKSECLLPILKEMADVI